MGAAVLEVAARQLVDPIEHDRGLLGKIIGGIVGLVAGAALVLLLVSNPIGWFAIGAALTVGFLGMQAGEWAGEKIGKLFDYDAGDIVKGSPNVTVGHRTLFAARAKDPVKCHSGQKIAEGCATVSINLLPAVRKGHKTECSGKVKEGCATVKYGGPSVQVLPINEPGLPLWYRVLRVSVEWGGALIGLFGVGGAIKGARLAFAAREAWTFGRATYAAAQTYSAVDGIIGLPRKWAEGKMGEAYETLTGEPNSAPGWLRQREFTQQGWYQNTTTAWDWAGVGVAGHDMMHAYRGTGWKPAATPDATPGAPATSGADGPTPTQVVPPAPARTPDPPAAPPGSHPEGRVLDRTNSPTDGSAFVLREGSSIYQPDRELILPPRVSPPSPAVAEGASALPPPAPRPSGLLGPDGNPLPPSTPPVSPPAPPVSPSSPTPPPAEPPAAPRTGFFADPTAQDDRVTTAAGMADKANGRREEAMKQPPPPPQTLGTPRPVIPINP